MWFQRHEEPKAITDEYEQVSFKQDVLLISGDYFLLSVKAEGIFSLI